MRAAPAGVWSEKLDLALRRTAGAAARLTSNIGLAGYDARRLLACRRRSLSITAGLPLYFAPRPGEGERQRGVRVNRRRCALADQTVIVFGGWFMVFFLTPGLVNVAILFLTRSAQSSVPVYKVN